MNDDDDLMCANDHNVPNALLHKITRQVRALNAVLAEVQKYEPGANWYLAADILMLMRGPSHADDGATLRPLQSNLVEGWYLKNSGGGDW